MKRNRIIVALVVVLTAALTGAAFYFKHTGHYSMEWQDFRAEFGTGQFRELRIRGRTIKAFYSDGQPAAHRKEIVVHAPSDGELKAIVYSANKHGVTLVFENSESLKP
jgi:ribosomal protein L25 (general stress protein Ctc)